MKNITIVLITIVLLTSCMALQPKYTYPEMVAVNVYDNSRWNKNTGSGNANQFITESVPKGQTVHNWKEIITLQYYSRNANNYSIKQHLKEKKNLLTSACPNIKFTVLSESDAEAVYRWTINNCTGQEDQYEVARYIKTEHGIHRISYAQKNSRPTQADFDKWLYIINRAHIVKTK